MAFYHTLLEQYAIMESLDSIIASNPHIPKLIISGYHKDALPDNNKKDRLLNHVLKLHNSGAITPDTAHLLKPHLTALSNTNQLNKLDSLNTLEDHINATKGIMDKAVTKKQRVDKDTPVILNTPDILVRQHLTHESAEKAARMHLENPMYKKTAEHGKAAWCVSLGGSSGEDHYKKYTENGEHPMYTIYHKGTKRIHALVANPEDTRATVELRDEQDSQPYVKNDALHQFIADHPGLEKTPAGDHLRRLTDEHLAQEKQKVEAALHNPDKLHAAFLDPEISIKNRVNLLDSRNRNEQHIISILSNKDIPIPIKRYALSSRLSDKVRPEDINNVKKPLMDILTDENAPVDFKQSVAASPRISQEHADYIMNGDNAKLKRTLLGFNQEYVKPEHVDNIIYGNDDNLKNVLIRDHDNLIEPRHITHILNQPTPPKHQYSLRKLHDELRSTIKEYYPHLT